MVKLANACIMAEKMGYERCFFFGPFAGLYVTKSMQTPGGGDILMALLGPLTLTYGFTLFRQRSVSMHYLNRVIILVDICDKFQCQ